MNVPLREVEWTSVAAVVVGVVNLLAVVTAIFKGGRWAGTVDEKFKVDEAWREKVTAKLGNGTPGQVVLVPTCERLHAAVSSELGVVRDDIRELREVVIQSATNDRR